MIKSLYTAASGMAAQQTNLDNIASNIANVNTTGFKRSRIEFQDLIYETLRKTTPTTQGTTVPSELQIGGGTKVVSSVKNFEQGTPTHTGNALDMTIEGDGFFQVLMPDGTTSYTRDGSIGAMRPMQRASSLSLGLRSICPFGPSTIGKWSRST